MAKKNRSSGNANLAESVHTDMLRKYNQGDPALGFLAGVRANYYTQEGLKQGAANNSEAAIAAFTKALAVTPGDPDVLYNLGVAYFTEGRYSEALNALDRSLQIRPGVKRVTDFYAFVKEKMEKK